MIQGPYASAARPPAGMARLTLSRPSKYPAARTSTDGSYSSASPAATPQASANIPVLSWWAPQSSAAEYRPIAAPAAAARCRAFPKISAAAALGGAAT